MALSTNKEGNVVTKLASATELPRMVKVRQKLDHSHIEPEEIPALVQRELEPMRSRIRAGMRVAITCGSRGGGQYRHHYPGYRGFCEVLWGRALCVPGHG